jgi:hypothetical protein
MAYLLPCRTQLLPALNRLQVESESECVEALKVGRQAIDELLECDPGDLEKFHRIALAGAARHAMARRKAQKVKAMR